MKLTFLEIRLLLVRLLIALAVYPVGKILFFIFNHSYFQGVSFTELLPILFFGLRFDIASVVLLNAVFILLHIVPSGLTINRFYQKALKVVFLISNGAAILADCVDLEYYRFTMKRTTYDFFELFSLGNDLYTLLPQYFRDFWHVILLATLLITGLAILYNRTKRLVRQLPKDEFTWSRAGSWLVLNALVIGLAIIGFRGGTQLRPIMTINASEYVSAQNIPLIINTPFSIIKSYGLEQLEEKTYFSDQDLRAWFNPEKKASSTADSARPNVFIIVLESFSKEYVGSLSGKPTCTPFLDSLIGQGLVFTNAFANGKKSIEGIPAILGGLPSLMNESYITSAYCSNDFDGIASKLRQLNYQSAFFHGGTKGTMGFDAFCGAAGYDQYFGRETYNNEEHFDGHWGIWDEELFQYTIGEVNKMKEPFLSTLMSLSSHHPFKVPDKYKDRFNEPDQPVRNSVRYSDHALRLFFKEASRQSWFKNTLFVLTADHTGPSQDAYYGSIIGSFEVPILFYDPTGRLKGRMDRVAQQIDIVPTLLNRLGYPDPYFAFGNDLLDTASERNAINFTSNIYQILDDEYLLQFDGNQTIALFRYKTDSLLQSSLSGSEKEAVTRLESKLKAIIQTYHNGMINNRLTIRN